MKRWIPFALVLLFVAAAAHEARAVLPRPDVVAVTREELNERIVRKLYDDMLNNYKFEDSIGYVSQWVIQHNTPGGEVHGVQRFRKTYEELKAAFPDYKFTVQEVIADGNKVAVRYRFTGTNSGPLLGITPSNKRVSVWGLDYMRVEEGKIRETWGSPVSGALLEAIGGVKTSNQPPAALPQAQPPPTPPT